MAAPWLTNSPTQHIFPSSSNETWSSHLWASMLPVDVKGRHPLLACSLGRAWVLYLDQGHVFRGAGWALEIGHMPYTGARRWLGANRAECLEAYVSGKVLEEIASAHGVAIGNVFTAARRNPALADHVADFVRNQANAVGSAVAILSPETILLGGGICEMPDFPKPELVAAIQSSFPFEQIGQVVDVRWATLGWQSVLYGAPLLAADRTA